MYKKQASCYRGSRMPIGIFEMAQAFPFFRPSTTGAENCISAYLMLARTLGTLYQKTWASSKSHSRLGGKPVYGFRTAACRHSNLALDPSIDSILYIDTRSVLLA